MELTEIHPGILIVSLSSHDDLDFVLSGCLLSNSSPISFFIQQSILYDHIHCFNAVFDLSSGSKIRACKCNEDIHSSWSLDNNHKSSFRL